MNIFGNTDLLAFIAPASSGIGKGLQAAKPETSFADYFKKDMAKEEKVLNNSFGTVDRSNNQTPGKKTVKPREITPEKPVDLAKDQEVAGLIEQILVGLQQVANQPDNGPGEWKLPDVTRDFLQQMGKNAGMSQARVDQFANKILARQEKVSMPEFLAYLKQAFADHQQDTPIKLPETDLPLLETFLSRLGVDPAKLASIAEKSVTADASFDLGLFVKELADLKNPGEITLSQWEGEQLYILLSHAGADRPLLHKLLPEQSLITKAARLLESADIAHNLPVNPENINVEKITLNLDRLKHILAETVKEVKADQPQINVVKFMGDLETVLDQAGFAEKTIGWTPVIFDSLQAAYDKLQNIVQGSLTDNKAISAAPNSPEVFAPGNRPAKGSGQQIPPGTTGEDESRRSFLQTDQSGNAGEFSLTPGEAELILDELAAGELKKLTPALLELKTAVTRAEHLLAEISRKSSLLDVQKVFQGITGIHDPAGADPVGATRADLTLQDILHRTGIPLGEIKELMGQLPASASRSLAVLPVSAADTGREIMPVLLSDTEADFFGILLKRSGIRHQERQAIIKQLSPENESALRNLIKEIPGLEKAYQQYDISTGRLSPLQSSARGSADQKIAGLDITVLKRTLENHPEIPPLALSKKETTILDKFFQRLEMFGNRHETSAPAGKPENFRLELSGKLVAGEGTAIESGMPAKQLSNIQTSQDNRLSNFLGRVIKQIEGDTPSRLNSLKLNSLKQDIDRFITRLTRNVSMLEKPEAENIRQRLGQAVANYDAGLVKTARHHLLQANSGQSEVSARSISLSDPPIMKNTPSTGPFSSLSLLNTGSNSAIIPAKEQGRTTLFELLKIARHQVFQENPGKSAGTAQNTSSQDPQIMKYPSGAGQFSSSSMLPAGMISEILSGKESGQAQTVARERGFSKINFIPGNNGARVQIVGDHFGSNVNNTGTGDKINPSPWPQSSMDSLPPSRTEGSANSLLEKIMTARVDHSDVGNNRIMNAERALNDALIDNQLQELKPVLKGLALRAALGETGDNPETLVAVRQSGRGVGQNRKNVPGGFAGAGKNSRLEMVTDKNPTAAGALETSPDSGLWEETAPGTSQLIGKNFHLHQNSHAQQGMDGENSLQGLTTDDGLQMSDKGGIQEQKAAGQTTRLEQQWQNQVFSQIFKGVARGLQKQEHHLVMQLYPKDLGKVKVDMTVKNGHVSVNFGMENVQVKEMLENSMGQFRENLAKHGFVLDGLDVSVNQQNAENEKYSRFEFIDGNDVKTASKDELPVDILPTEDRSRYRTDQTISVVA